MSIVPWIQEKSLAALQEAAKLVDLANDPETTDWYAKELRRRAIALIARLLPLVTTFFDADDEAMSPTQVSAISEGGSFALAKWCKKNEVGDPRDLFASAVDKTAEKDVKSTPGGDDQAHAGESSGRTSERDEVRRRAPIRAGDARPGLKTAIFGGMAHRMLRDPWPPTATKLMLWLLSRLELSEFADAVMVSARFLPGDVGVSPDAITEAYDWLYEHGCIERVETSGSSRDQRCWRLVVEGINESRDPVPHTAETFGFPGYMIDGRRAEWCSIDVPVTSSAAEALVGWGDQSASLAELQDAIQTDLGHRQVVCELRLAGPRGDRQLHVKLRALSDRDEESLVRRATESVERWLRERYSGR